MFNSGISAADLIAEIQNEADFVIPIPNKTYVTWLNSLEQLLYGDIIREQGSVFIVVSNGPSIKLSDISVPSGESKIRYEDIYTVIIDDKQLTKSTLTSGRLFPLTYWLSGDGIITCNMGNEGTAYFGSAQINYIRRPALKSVDGDIIQAGNVAAPIEFIELVKSKLRGEAYKFANEDGLAAKWMSDYDVLIENFKVWVQSRRPQLGM